MAKRHTHAIVDMFVCMCWRNAPTHAAHLTLDLRQQQQQQHTQSNNKQLQQPEQSQKSSWLGRQQHWGELGAGGITEICKFVKHFEI